MVREQGSTDEAVNYLLRKAQEANVETGWDRFSAMQEACPFGDMGLCCQQCMLGPCRIDPFGEGLPRGICGISRDGIVARNLCRMIAVGTSAHSDHAAHILELFKRVGAPEESAIGIKDSMTLYDLAKQLGFPYDQRNNEAARRHLADAVQEAYCATSADGAWLSHAIPKIRRDKLRMLGLLPHGIDPVIRETMHRTNMGVDADPWNLLYGAIKCSLADFLGMDIASKMSDILVGVPAPVLSEANLGVLDAEAVNIVVHGHSPLLVESIIRAVPEFEGRAKEAGAANGINIVAICCGGSEVLTRNGIPLATNLTSQEMAILTGAVDAMIANAQCTMPSLESLCECYHTELVSIKSVARTADTPSVPGEGITGQETPPCRLACPIEMDVQGYLALIAEGKYQEAYQLIRKTNPLPAICGRVCYHPCENVCNHGYVSEPLAIASLKRFVADQVDPAKLEVPEVASNGKMVAIIGSGPAGLAAAHDLALRGYRVTIFEGLPEAGGMLWVGIPDYRLPKDILERDIEYIRRLGVAIKTDCKVGEQVTLDSLKRDYQAIFIATGAHQSLKLGVPGEESPGVIPGVDFLRAINMGKVVPIGARVAVIGGGNTAIDAARVARRLGASVTVIYRRSRSEMPASQAEIKAAEEEGIEIMLLATPTQILTEEGRVSGIECIRMALGEPDSSGRPRPVPTPGTEFTTNVDTVMPALGQTVNLEFTSGIGLELSPRGNLLASEATLSTNIEGIFAGGDVVTGPAMVIDAIAAGKKAARSIDSYLKGEPLASEERRAPEGLSEQEVSELKKLYPPQPRTVMPELDAATRVKDFTEVELGYTIEQAKGEASRCFACGDWVKGSPPEASEKWEKDSDKGVSLLAAEHIELELVEAQESAARIIGAAIHRFKERNPKQLNIPEVRRETVVGFSPEAILALLGKVNSNDPLEPLIQRLTGGEIYGIVHFVGCNNYKVVQDVGFLEMARKLARDNVLMLATGCAAGVFAKNGFMSPQATLELCGDRIRQFLEELGSATGFGRPLPPVWHLGSCFDQTRSIRLCSAVASRLGVDLDQLPVVTSAPEVMSEKSVAMVTWSVALGLTTHLGIVPPVFGGKIVTKVLTETLKDILGARFMVETDPEIAYQEIKETLTEKRIGLGLK